MGTRVKKGKGNNKYNGIILKEKEMEGHYSY
jgi:hypothetical protein